MLCANNKQFSFQSWRENLASNPSDDESPPALAGMSKDGEIRLWRFELAVGDALLNRQPFITSDSRMGWGLDDVREGDLIALFLGVQVPFVKRGGIWRMYFSRRVLCPRHYGW